ncbi:MAG TPA: protein-L-isoaspartate O-methyltransferase [Rhizobiaceae bacterium]|nr:protein-L-isoaspartate O-methyltransferase [Rhizobiaceae bacterium]
MNADFSQHRAKMVDGQLRTTDVTNQPLLAAMGSVPREAFVEARRQQLAYIDEDIEIAPAGAAGGARYLMEPSPFAKLVQLADVRQGDVVLDVGCGTGYSSAVLSLIAGSVIALESDSELAERAGSLLGSLGYDNVAVVQGALREGYPDEAPYDVIVIEGSVGEIPEALFAQLKEGGRLVAVEGVGNAGVAKLYVKDGDVVTGRRAFNAAVKPLPGFEKAPAFEF